MALEPITRKEKIIAGENLEPITRMEQFLKKFGGSGGSGGSGGGGGGVTTLHINVTGGNVETKEATFTADKTTTEMQQASANGPIWCVISFPEGIMAVEAVSFGLPPVWKGYGTSFGGIISPVHKENGNNDYICAVSGFPPNEWVIDLRAFGS